MIYVKIEEKLITKLGQVFWWLKFACVAFGQHHLSQLCWSHKCITHIKLCTKKMTPGSSQRPT